MSFLIICSVALLASALTFFSGFGLGTLLLPAFALFVPIEQAVGLAAVVHFFNGLFKLALVGRFADRRVLLRFGLPADDNTGPDDNTGQSRSAKVDTAKVDTGQSRSAEKWEPKRNASIPLRQL